MNPHRQRGVVLVVSLLMIAVLALLATASINLGTGSMLIVENQQSEQVAVSAADALIEETLSDLPALQNGTALGPETRGTLTVQRTSPVCVGSTTLPGFSLTNNLALQHNYYRFQVSATEANTGAGATIQTGARVLQNAGTC